MKIATLRLVSVHPARARQFVTALIFALSGAPAYLQAEENNFHVGASIGYTHVKGQTSTDFTLPETLVYEIAFDEDISFQGEIGYRFDTISTFFGGTRINLELIYDKHDALQASRSIRTTSVSEALPVHDGGITVVSAISNWIFEFDKIITSDRFTPYIGLGIGATWIREDLRFGNTLSIDDADAVFAYQLIGGVTYEVSSQWELFLQGRAFDTIESDQSLDDTTPGNRRINLLSELGGYSGHLGFRFRF